MSSGSTAAERSRWRPGGQPAYTDTGRSARDAALPDAQARGPGATDGGAAHGGVADGSPGSVKGLD
jgi:hypothetical protein